jgi:ribosomal protein L7/L12
MIEGLPKVIFKEVNTKNAEEWKKALTDAGAVVELI